MRVRVGLRCVFVVGSAVMLLAGCTSDAGWLDEQPGDPSGPPDLAPLVDDETVERIARHLESTLGSELVEWPRVTVRTPVPDRSAPAASENAPDDLLRWNPRFRDVLDLPPARQRTTPAEAAGYYRGDNDEIVLNVRPDWTSAFAEKMLVHELTHAADPDMSERAGAETSDNTTAGWARTEGLARLVEFRWTERIAELPPFGEVTFDGAVVRQAQVRLDHEQRRHQAESVPHSDPVSSLLPFFDLSIPIDWQAPVVDDPELPEGTEVLRRDVIGIEGLLEMIWSPYVSDQLAATGWRGDATILYRYNGTMCVSSRLVFADQDATVAAFLGLTDSGFSPYLVGDEIRLDVCEGGFDRGVVPPEIDYQHLDSVMRLAVRVASVIRYDDPEFAMCIARAEHVAPEYAAPRTWTRTETIDVIVRRTGECR